MRLKSRFSIVSLSLFLAVGIAQGSENSYEPKPLPLRLRVESSAPRKELWLKLDENEKALVYHLTAAAEAGRTILFYQNHRHGLTLKNMLERSLSAKGGRYTKALLGAEAFDEYLIYAGKFQDLTGPYSSSNRKFVLRKAKPEQIDELFKVFSPKVTAKVREEVAKLMTDDQYEVIHFPEAETGEGLENSGTNLYEKGLSGKEIKEAFDAGFESGLNCRIVRKKEGGVRCSALALNNPELDPVVRIAMEVVVSELRQALPFTLTDHQKKQIEYLIRYLEAGNVQDFRKMNIEWVQDRATSKVDFMMGFVEVYEDYMGKIGSWESYVQVVDPTTTEMSLALAKHAQHFEDNMPYGEFKKTFPEDYSPPALMVYFLQEVTSMHVAGYNLPNYDDIRRDVGAKNVIKLPLPGEDKDADVQRVRKEFLSEFVPVGKVESVLGEFDRAWRTVVLLHEIIGHGSGTYDTSKYKAEEDPVIALGQLGSALEEQRADLTALVHAADPALIEVGIYKDQDEANRARDLMYDFIVADFTRRVARERTFTEAHQRGHWLLTNILLERGAIEWVAKDGTSEKTLENQVLQVKDYKLFHDVCVDVLSDLQRIKATRDEAGLEKLFRERAPLDAANEPWVKAIIKRGENFGINAGFIEQPWSIDEELEFNVEGELSLESVAQQWNHHYRPLLKK